MSLLPHYKVSHNKALISSIDKLAGYAQCPRPTDRKQTDSLSSKLHICRENKSTSTISKCLGGRSASICGNLCSLEEFKTKIQREKDLQELLKEVKIIWIQNEANGKHLKRTVWIRRYKLVDIFHTDREIKSKGKEVINLENGLYGIVEQYQNIEVYETVDFGKPGRSMDMGMMPAKLAHMMINIWLTNVIHHSDLDIENLVIYDPFVWSWTTWMLANHLGYDFIGSDIKTTYAEQNAIRRKTTKFHTPDKQFNIFTQDITKKIENQLINEKMKRNVLIVTEWRLWPIVGKNTSSQDIQKFQKQVLVIYKSFLDRIQELSIWGVKPSVIFTIPYYANQESSWTPTNSLEKDLSDYGTQMGIHIQAIPEIYGREWQNVGRKIMIIR